MHSVRTEYYCSFSALSQQSHFLVLGFACSVSTLEKYRVRVLRPLFGRSVNCTIATLYGEFSDCYDCDVNISY